MNEDTRRTWELVFDVLDVLERHGYHRAGNQQTGEAVALIGHLARTYEGTQEAPSTADSARLAPVPPAGPEQPGPPADHAVTVSAAERRTILAALDEAADLKRDRAANCAECADQTCGNCQFRLRTAHAYDAAAARLLAWRQASAPGIPARQPASGGMPQTTRESPPEAEAGR